ncbi:MAG TPA: dTDP-4-dehydrorhamnose reductase [Chthonomonadaceae bacterium]|nr:dTDP-4-dehydrorhamnose reductase [Chthonomonadaceae bacterium]
MRILVTGANGMLGIDLCTLLAADGHELIRTDIVANDTSPDPWEPLDITDPHAVARCLLEHQPDVVIHSAAYTDVDGCERNPDQAFRVNALGTWNVASVCGGHHITLVYISTDFVFDGSKNEPYTEFDTPNPLSRYGASKLAGEQFVRQLCRQHFIARTAWLFGVHGPSFPSKMLELARTRTELSVVVDQVGCPTHTRDLARALMALLRSQLFGTYHITNAGSCSWYEFARATLELSGVHNVLVHPMPADKWPSPTRRPAYSVLRRYALELQGRDTMRPWREALADYLALRTAAVE